MRFRVLGPVEIETGEGFQATPKALKLRSLLAYLCVHRGEAVSSSRLTEALWSGAPPRTASTALHVYVSKLRKHLDGLGLDASSVITTQPPGYRLNPGDYTLDVAELDTLLTTAAELRRRGCPERASQVLGRAVSLWQGRALEDLRELPLFDSIGRQLDERLSFAQEQRFEIELELGNHKGIVGELYSLVDDRPTWENLHEYLMLALYRGGRTAEALSIFDRIRRNLVGEFGIEPAPRLQRLHHAVLTHDPSLGAHFELSGTAARSI
ncbi:BTAD domain-containing putative transcriptional regulator [Streptomyces sp. NRRL S-87]|uniref:AfsR/SARP family transcriptional regulator n=1 Tax=Streptomyces sp. NRRL S-87 TaxID=1463920 RepID=UPI0005608645|nr:BTAD domain-containing putative transcriptional regulator [Streptomyces sp. NRRL S-87]